MTELLITVFNMSIAASIVAVAVMLVRIPLKKVPKIFSYVLWVAVLLRLVCPFSFESPTSLMPANAEIIPSAISTVQDLQIHSGLSPVDNADNLLIANTATSGNANLAQTALTICTDIWICGIVVLLFYAVLGYIVLKRRVYDATLRSGNIFETDKISTAFVLGFIRPKIYIPLTADREQVGHILEHEQVHIRRRDYLIKALAFLAVVMHWFNPIIWVSYCMMSKDMEMSCDEAVLQKAGDDIRQAYSVSLVSLYTRKQGLLSPLAFGTGNHNNMKARVKNVLKFKITPRWATVLCSFLVVLFTLGFTTNPVQGLTKEKAAAGPSDYKLYGLTVTQGENSQVVYYKGQRVRLFVDLDSNDAFVCCYTDKDGTIDIRTIKNEKGENIGIEYIPSNEASEILNDMDLLDNTMPDTSPNEQSSIFTNTPIRIEMEDIPSDLQAWIDKCDENTGMYITVYNNSYVFYCNQIRSYAWQPSLKNNKITIALTELKGAGDGYALITVPGYEKLTVTLKDASVTKSMGE